MAFVAAPRRSAGHGPVRLGSAGLARSGLGTARSRPGAASRLHDPPGSPRLGSYSHGMARIEDNRIVRTANGFDPRRADLHRVFAPTCHKRATRHVL
ncbi:hypothetical protein EZV77_29720 [Burkholderia thailandensis]|nr:hypothetical protein EZV77_29720 [Burkholderia thailandensis]